MEILSDIFRGILGIATLIGICYLLSSNRKRINWKMVGIGLGTQLFLAIGILKGDKIGFNVPIGDGFRIDLSFISWIFEAVGQVFVNILNYTIDGSKFLLGGLMDIDSNGYIFAFQVLPTIIFFAALTSVLFYLGIIQKVVKALAKVLTKLLNISGAESLSIAGNIFLGQTEAPLMIKPYLEKMTKSEILLVMVGGMATVAGGVLAAYIGFLGGDDPEARLKFAKHLLAASVMAAPGAIVFSKILFPQTDPINAEVEVSNEVIGSNFLDAIANGTTEGLKLAANVAAMLLVFIAFIAMANGILGWIGQIPSYHVEDFNSIQAILNNYANWAEVKNVMLSISDFDSAKTQILELIDIREINKEFKSCASLNEISALINYYDNLSDKWFSFNTWIQNNSPYQSFSLEAILGTIFAPLMWLIGVADDDVMLMGQLLGIKLAASEFVGYVQLADLKDVNNAIHLTHEKSILMATYMLCGFANFASIGIQIGGIGSLAPGQRKTLSEFGLKAVIGGSLASLLSATIVGMLF